MSLITTPSPYSPSQQGSTLKAPGWPCSLILSAGLTTSTWRTGGKRACGGQVQNKVFQHHSSDVSWKSSYESWIPAEKVLHQIGLVRKNERSCKKKTLSGCLKGDVQTGTDYGLDLVFLTYLWKYLSMWKDLLSVTQRDRVKTTCGWLKIIQSFACGMRFQIEMLISCLQRKQTITDLDSST